MEARPDPGSPETLQQVARRGGRAKPQREDTAPWSRRRERATRGPFGPRRGQYVSEHVPEQHTVDYSGYGRRTARRRRHEAVGAARRAEARSTAVDVRQTPHKLYEEIGG